MGNKNNTGDLEDFMKQMQNWVEKKQKEDRQISADKVNNDTAESSKILNTEPRADCNGFTAEQMSKMVYSPLEPCCPVQLRHLTEDQILEIPIMRQALHLMNALSEKELKLTAKGSLPIKMVETLYQMGTHSLETDWYNKKSEAHTREVLILRIVLEETGLIKKKLGKLSLTIKGKKLLKDHNELLRTIILFLLKEYNTGYFDGYEDPDTGNVGLVYSLWLLHHYGDRWRLLSFYASEYFKAFNNLKERNPYSVRVFKRLFRYIGLCEINDDEFSRGKNWNEKTRKTPLLDMMFSFEEPAKE